VTGVEKVRFWACTAVEAKEVMFGYGQHIVFASCLAYGAYLRGLIDVVHESGYYRYLVDDAIDAWKEVIK